jgi:hypothetical protein
MSVGAHVTKWISVDRPEVLGGEAILLVPHPENLEDAERAHPDLVAYLPDELREVERLRNQPALVRAAHCIKKTLSARIIPPDSPLGRWAAARVTIPAERFHSAEKETDSDG